MNDDQFRRLLDWFDFPWSGYRKVRKGVKKRITRHMRELNCTRIEAYLDLLEQSRAVRRECRLRMTVSISRFFRDRQLWNNLAEDILPSVIKRKKKTLRVWSAGCARGEEVYSFKIVWQHLKERYEQRPQLEITATDMHPDYIEKGRAGVYTRSSMSEVSQNDRERYFDIRKGGNLYKVKAFLKMNIDWNVRDFFAEPPGPGYDIIFLRNNLLTYYKDPLKEEGLKRVGGALAPGGWLIVGSHERMPEVAPNFLRHPAIPWAYRQDEKK